MVHLENKTSLVIILANYFCVKCFNFHKKSIFVKDFYMSLNKNKIFRISSLCMGILGTALILLGLFKYREYAIGFSVAGVGFYAVSWAFNALKGRV